MVVLGKYVHVHVNVGVDDVLQCAWCQRPGKRNAILPIEYTRRHSPRDSVRRRLTPAICY